MTTYVPGASHESRAAPEAPAGGPKRVAVVAGAGGVVGASLVAALAAEDWEVVGLSRQRREMPGARWVGVDLVDESNCAARLGSLTDATHLFCAARYNFAEGGREPIEENLAVVRNAVEVLDSVAPGLRHVHLVQGMKYYGSHIGPFMTPAKEHHPRSLVPNFYYQQQDYLEERQRGARWTWSASRPDGMIHAQAGVPRNLVSIIAVYALLCRELGQPFSFPGSQAAFNAVYQVTSTEHLAAGLAWMSEAPAAANQAYNMVNGDYIRWANLWPVFARYFDVEAGPVRTFSLAEAMADKEPVWERILRRHDLRPLPFASVAHWGYADYMWSRGWDVMADMTKARLHGFVRAVDTEAEFLRYFEELRAQRVIS
jgi:nucleoside-diphosphate-sugar epimerase